MDVKTKLSDGKEYIVGSIKHKAMKILKKTAGDDKVLLGDLLIMDCVKSPKITQAELDDMDAGDTLRLERAAAKALGIEQGTVRDF